MNRNINQMSGEDPNAMLEEDMPMDGEDPNMTAPEEELIDESGNSDVPLMEMSINDLMSRE